MIVLGAGRVAHAADMPADSGLYQATAIVTGTDMRQRPLGFAETLKEVLVKVSGAPTLDTDPRVAKLTQHAERFVASFAYVDPNAWILHHDDQGTYDRSYELTVRFDPAKIDAALAAFGVAPWRGTRPLLTPIIIVRQDQNPYFLTVESSAPRAAEMRQTIIRIAAAYGLGVHFPSESDIAAWGLPLAGFPAPLAADDTSRLRVTGALAWDVHAMGWVGTWHVMLNDSPHDWRISGVGFDQAFDSMIRGAVLIAHGTGSP